MGMEIGHYPDEDRLDLTIGGNLDLTLTPEVLRACELVDRRLRFCVIDSTRITRVFDSGIALMLLLIDRLRAAGVELIVLGVIPGLYPHLRRAGVEPRPQPGRVLIAAAQR
jgi:anti-anti-sigma regulatory factor